MDTEEAEEERGLKEKGHTKSRNGRVKRRRKRVTR